MTSVGGSGRACCDVKKEELRATITTWLEQFSDDQAQIDALVARVVSAELENQRLESASAELQKTKTCMGLMTQKLERCESLLSKTELAKSKLEVLCRELQKSNREIKEENLERLKQMDRSRQEMVDQFRGSLADIQQSVDAGRERSQRLAGDNESLAGKLKDLAGQYEEKLKSLAEQYEQKQSYSDQLNSAKDLEMQLVKAKLETATLRFEELLIEKEKIELLLKERDQVMQEALASEKSLREQISRYSDKYSELHKSLSVSNETFDRFKKEMERMNANLVKVQRESHKWKEQFEEANKTVLTFKKKTKEMEESLALKGRQVNRLEQLCRTLAQQNACKGTKTNAPIADETAATHEESCNSNDVACVSNVDLHVSSSTSMPADAHLGENDHVEPDSSTLP